MKSTGFPPFPVRERRTRFGSERAHGIVAYDMLRSRDRDTNRHFSVHPEIFMYIPYTDRSKISENTSLCCPTSWSYTDYQETEL